MCFVLQWWLNYMLAVEQCVNSEAHFRQYAPSKLTDYAWRTDRCERSTLANRLSGFDPLATVTVLTGSPTSPRSSHCDSSIRAWLSVGTTNPFPWVPQDRIWATTISASSSFTNFIPFVPWVMNSGSLQKLWFIQWCHMGIVLCHKCLQENVKWICDDMFSVVYYFLWNNPLWHQETINQRTILKQSSCLKYQ